MAASKSVTFIGGPWDLHRVALDDLPNIYKVARATRATASFGIEGAMYSDLGYFESVYEKQTSHGVDHVVYVWLYDTDSTPIEVKVLRDKNQRMYEELRSLRAKVAKAKYELSE